VRIAVLGGGGREHALLDVLARGASAEQLYAVPGNAGTGALAENIGGVSITDPSAVTEWAKGAGIDLVVVGPEAPLVVGVADELAAGGVAVFGPTAAAARIEGSKAFAKEVMAAAGVPTARAEAFTDARSALHALSQFGPPWVVKADGLAAGKGVTVTSDQAAAADAVTAALIHGVHGDAGRRVLLEEYLDGPEASVFALSDGHTVVPLAAARDYKRVGDGGSGPNTGGMGAYSPLPDVPADLLDQINKAVLEPTVAELARRGAPYQGVLYAGLALTADGPRVIEFNCRFGDPETQAVVPRLASDLAELLLATAQGNLAEVAAGGLAWDPRVCVTVVLAAGGYPGPFRRGLPIDGLAEAAAVDGVEVYHAGTTLDRSGEVVTAGGRVLAVSALADTTAAARDLAYEAAERVSFTGAHFRRDIAASVTPGDVGR
jgi:phosphoribosylamine---glycine ligase